MSDDARAVSTPYGPGVSLYPDPGIVFVDPERALLIAIWDRAMRDAEWLDELEATPSSTWTSTQRDRYRTMLRGILDPRTWLAEQRAA